MLPAGPVPAYRTEVLRTAERVVRWVGRPRLAVVPVLLSRSGTEEARLAQRERPRAVRSRRAELARGHQGRGVRLHVEGGLGAHRAHREVLVEAQTWNHQWRGKINLHLINSGQNFVKNNDNELSFVPMFKRYISLSTWLLPSRLFVYQNSASQL